MFYVLLSFTCNTRNAFELTTTKILFCSLHRIMLMLNLLGGIDSIRKITHTLEDCSSKEAKRVPSHAH